MSLRHKETNTWTGSGEGRFNEDFALVVPEQGCAALVDGATGLTKVNLVAGESDAAWYARHLAHALAHELACPGSSVADAYHAAGAQVAEQYRHFPGATELARIDEPNGSVATLTWDDDKVTLGLLGDCTAVVTFSDGRRTTYHDDTLTQLDEENYQRMLAWATEHDATMAQARRALNDRFIENRLKMNEPGGYDAADISCRGMRNVQTFSFSASEVRSVLACTDGYAAAVDMGVVPDGAALAMRVESGEGFAVGEELRAAEQADAGCWRVPRSKTSDDATYFLVVFG